MNKFKKIISAVLAIVLVASLGVCLFGCDGGGDGGKTPGNETVDYAKKFADAEATWNTATGTKTATDELEIVLEIPLAAGDPVSLTIEGSITREYKGEDIVSLSGVVTKAEVFVGTLLNSVKSIVPSLDLNKLLKVTKDAAISNADSTVVTWTQLTNGGWVREAIEGKDEAYTADAVVYVNETGEAVEVTADNFKYIQLLASDGKTISLANEDGLAGGKVKIDDGEIVVEEGFYNVLGFQGELANELTVDAVSWTQIEDIMADYDIAIDYDMLGIMDYGVEGATYSKGKTDSIVKAKFNAVAALDVLLGQFWDLIDSFMEGDIDSDIEDTINAFLPADGQIDFSEADDPNNNNQAIDILNAVKGYAQTYIDVVAGAANSTLEEAVLSLISFDEGEATITLAGDKLSKIAGEQKAELCLSEAKYKTIVGKLGTDEQYVGVWIGGTLLPNIVVTGEMTVKTILDLVPTIIFNGEDASGAKALVVGITISYETTYEY